MRFFFVILLFIGQVAKGQFNYVVESNVEVLNAESNTIAMPWGGGLNAVQFNTIDFNNDGVEDVVLYDRMASKIITLKRAGNALEYAPEYESFFPQVSYWILLRDFNGDGLKDIFTGDNLGIRVYENTTTGTQTFTWKQVLFYTGFPGPKSDVLLTKGISLKVNLQLNFDDLPSISDADGDGDLDIFSPSFSGTSIEYHKNLSVEKYGLLDSLDFERVTQQWGNVTDCGCGNFLFDGSSCPIGGRLSHAGGKSLLALDVDGDGDQDIVFSESTCSTLYLLKNNGTVGTPSVTNATVFPFPSSQNIFVYPAAYFEDADGDGVKDLIVSPNSYSRESLTSDFRQSVWFYKNIGSTAAPDFSAANPNYLQEQMIDVGDNSAPAFFDVDADGDFDLFIGSYATDNRGTISFYENVGTASQPVFRLVTEDFLSLAGANFVNIRPSFADMNGDATLDLAFTATAAFSFQTSLYYIANSSLKGGNFSGSIVNTNFSVFPNEPVTLADVDSDGKVDVFIGRLNGLIEFWKNTGVPSNPVWTLADDSFLNMGPNFSNQYPAASIADLNNDRKPELIIGDQLGGINIIENYQGVTGLPSKQPLGVYNRLTEGYVPIKVGGRAWPAVSNIFRAETPAMVIGNLLGGLYLIKPSTEDLLPEGPLIEVFPNPIFAEGNQQALVKVRTDRPAVLSVFSAMGQMIIPVQYLVAYQEYSIPLTQVNKGVYFLQFNINGKVFTRRIVKQ